jgi:hypothetical protein
MYNTTMKTNKLHPSLGNNPVIGQADLWVYGCEDRRVGFE